MYAQMRGITIKFRKPLASAEERGQGETVKENLCLSRHGAKLNHIDSPLKFGDGTTRLTKVLFGADGALGKSRSIVAGDDAPALKYTGTTCLMGLSSVPCGGIYFPSSDKENFHAAFFPTGEDEMFFQFHMPINEKDSNAQNWGNLSDSVGQGECQIAKEMNHKIDEARKKQLDQAYAVSQNRVTLLCDWIYEILERILRQIVAHRNAKLNLQKKTIWAALGRKAVALPPAEKSVFEQTNKIALAKLSTFPWETTPEHAWRKTRTLSFLIHGLRTSSETLSNVWQLCITITPS